MDVEMQVDSKGLLNDFAKTPEQAGQTDLASSLVAAAAIPNTEAAPVAPSDAGQSAKTETATPNGIHHNQTSPATNGVAEASPTVPAEPVAKTPSDEPKPESSATSLADSGIPPPSAPVPAEQAVAKPAEPAEPAGPDAMEVDPVQPTTAPVTDTAPAVEAPPSDAQTAPLPDGPTPGQVAKGEAQAESEKAKEDNAPATSQSAEAPAPQVTESLKLGDTGLATPPTQSPPPATKPDNATGPPSTIPEPSQPAVLSTEKAPEEEKTAESTESVSAAASVAPAPSEERAAEPQEPAPAPATVTVSSATPSAPPPAAASDAPAPATTPVTSVVPAASADREITDVPSQTKVSREREEDTDGGAEPATKRVKTDDNSQPPEFKVPVLPLASSPPQANGSPAQATDLRPDGDDSVTAPRLAQMKKIISNLKKSNASAAFRLPVDPVALNIPSYPEIIKNPMDLGTIDQKLKQNQYTRLSDFISDFELIVSNCVTFNGKEHAVTQAAFKMQNSFNNQMKNNMPQAAVVELSKEEKKAAKAKQEPTRQAPPRRPSVSTSQAVAAAGAAAGSARSPVTVPSTPFAPGPDGVPLIRRDSTMADGRPKRAIVPPKRNQEFAGGRPKKKKYELQLRFCQEVLKEIASAKHWQINQFFTHPVDPVALNIPTYFQVIKKPMDFETIQTKLNNNVYEKAKDFEEDVRLVFKNCYKFNPESDWVNQAGHQLEEMFDKKWATKDEWLSAREPQSDPQSEEDDDEVESEEEEDSEAERNEKIAALQKQIAEMSKQMGELTNKKSKKKSKSPSSAPKKSKSKSAKKDKAKTSFPGLQKSAERKKSSSSKAASKERYVTFQEKQYISNGIAMLPEKQMQEALKIIQQSVPSLANSAENEIELDIEEVPNHALIKLLAFVKRYAGPPPDEPKVVDSDGYSAGAVSKSKKNRPNKQEQEAQIEALRGQLGAYNGDAGSPGALQSIEPGDSSDDGDSEESEEE